MQRYSKSSQDTKITHWIFAAERVHVLKFKFWHCFCVPPSKRVLLPIFSNIVVASLNSASTCKKCVDMASALLPPVSSVMSHFQVLMEHFDNPDQLQDVMLLAAAKSAPLC